jgi:hypothetical protein
MAVTLSREQDISPRQKKVEFEIRTLRPKIIRRGQTFFRNVGVRIPSESDPLGLFPAKAVYSVAEYPSAYIYSSHFPEIRLVGSKFISFLSHCRPNYPSPDKYPTDKNGIEDDWVQGKTNKYLFELHRKIAGVHWEDFIALDRLRYLAALNVLDRERVVGEFRTQEGEIIGPKGRERLKKEAEDNIRTKTFSVKELHGRDWWLDTEVTFADYPLHIQEKLLSRVREEALEHRYFVDPKAKPGIIRNGSEFARSNRSVHHMGKGLVKFDAGKSWAIYDVNGERTYTRDCYVYRGEDDEISPWKVWAKLKDSGERMYLDGSLPLRRVFGVKDKSANRRMGLLLAGYGSPDHKNQLPEYVEHTREDGRTVKQQMLEAQMPLLVSLSPCREILLTARDFISFEQYTGF